MNNKTFITYSDIKINAPFKIKNVINLKIEQKFNDHSSADIDILLYDDEKIENVYTINENTVISIENLNDKINPIIFAGIPVKLDLFYINGILKVSVKLKSLTIKMDIIKKKRSFQNPKQLYHKIFNDIIAKEYNGEFIDISFNQVKQNRLIIQYEETDWEFLIRLASQLNTMIMPDITSNELKLWLEIPNGNKCIENFSSNFLSKNLESYFNTNSNFQNKTELDFTYYSFKTLNNYNVGDNITYNNVNFKISEKITKLINGYLIYEYKLINKEGIFKNILYNQKFIGLSIDAEILSVKQDCLKLHLSIDKEQNVDECCWFQINTLYTSEGETGFYCMPQVGDNVKLYFPNQNENSSYVKLVNRLDGENNINTQEPNSKYFGTVFGSKMEVLPDALNFVCLDNNYINMSNQSGTEINSNVNIKINSESNLQLEAENVVIIGAECIGALTPTSNIIVDEIVHLKG